MGIELAFDKELKVVSLKDMRFFKDKPLNEIDRMENLDQKFEGNLLPTEIKTSGEKSSLKLKVKIKNISKTEIKPNQLHRNLENIVDHKHVWGRSTFGMTASSGNTGLNRNVIKSDDIFTDQIAYENSIIETPSGVTKYIFVNYFKTTHN